MAPKAGFDDDGDLVFKKGIDVLFRSLFWGYCYVWVAGEETCGVELHFLA